VANSGEYGHSGTYGYGHTPYGHAIVSPITPTALVAGYSNKHRHGEQWGECTRCGFQYPFSQLRIQPGDKGGVIVCIVTCIDDPSILDLLPEELPTEQPLLFIDEGGPSA
jgi:hypothetical protein